MANKRIKDLATTKYKGFMALDDANGTGKMDVGTIFNNFAEEFVDNVTNARKNLLYIKDGILYKALENYSGVWDDTKFTECSISAALATIESNLSRYNNSKLSAIAPSILPMLDALEPTFYKEKINTATITKNALVRLKKLYGNSFTLNQYVNLTSTYNTLPYTVNDVTFSDSGNGVLHVQGLASADATVFLVRPFNFEQGHKYLIRGCPAGGASNKYFMSSSLSGDDIGEGKILTASSAVSNGYVYFRVKSGQNVNFDMVPIFVDLTVWFGAGNEPTSVLELYEKGFPVDYIPYNAGTFTHSKISEIGCKNSDGNYVAYSQLSTRLLDYLADKGYGESHGSDSNLLDIENKKFVQVGKYNGSTWTQNVSPVEFDLTEYIQEPIAIECYEGSIISFIVPEGFGVGCQFEGELLSVGSAVKKIETIDSISSLPLHNGVVDYDDTWWKTHSVSEVYKHVAIPCSGDKNIVTITAGTHDGRIIGLKNYEPPADNGAITGISDVWTRRVDIPAGDTYSFVIPSDVKYLIVNVTWNGESCVDSIEFSSLKNGLLGVEHDRNSGLHRITVAAQNVRDFNTSSGGEGDGCPDALVDTNLPLWKEQFSGFLNCDFLAMDEYYRYFDRSMTIDTYETLLKQFFPYKYMLPLPRDSAWGTQMLLSKWPCVMMDLRRVAKVGFALPTACVNMFGKKVAIVCWLQSVADTPETRMAAYSAAITALAEFDAVVVMGDFNTEVGMEELEVWTDAGYTLGNGGYWGEIKTWEDRTPNDNIVTRGFIFEKFEVGEYVTSDHKAVRARLSLES